MKKPTVNINISSLIGKIHITDISKTEFEIKVKLQECVSKLLSMVNSPWVIVPALNEKDEAILEIVKHLNDLNSAIEKAEALGHKLCIITHNHSEAMKQPAIRIATYSKECSPENQ